MKSNLKIVIVGGGLAGLTAAIHLSKIGYTVTLIEKNNYPKHKVCGEYVSNEVLPYLDWLGLNLEDWRATRIEQLHFSIESGQSIKTKLPLGGFGISRFAFDFYLYQKAIENHCKIIQETVDSVHYNQDIFQIQLSNNEIITSDFVLGAFGKRSNLDLKLKRHFIQKKSPWLAVKGHFKIEFPDDFVGLHHFKGGYCGVSKVENNIVNLCYLTDYDAFKQYKNIEEFEANILSKNPNLQKVLQHAIPVFDKPLSISQISFEKKKAVENHILMIGDSAGLIHPLCGNGMAMAIHSAKIASELIDDFYHQKIGSRTELETKYAEKWQRTFSHRIRTGRWLERLLRQPQLANAVMQIAINFPFLLRGIIKSTHGIKITAPSL